MRFLVLSMGIVGILSGCASMSTNETTIDKFTGREISRMTFNPLAGSTVIVDESQVRLEAMQSIEPNGDLYYVLAVNLSGNGNGWCFIESGESLLFVVDGERHALSGDGSAGSRDVEAGNVYETAIYETSPEFIRSLANANDVKVKVVGSKRSIERKFGKANFQNFKDFVEDIIDPSEANA